MLKKILFTLMSIVHLLSAHMLNAAAAPLPPGTAITTATATDDDTHTTAAPSPAGLIPPPLVGGTATPEPAWLAVLNTHHLHNLFKEACMLRTVEPQRARNEVLTKVILKQLLLTLFLDIQIAYDPCSPFIIRGLRRADDTSVLPRATLFFTLDLLLSGAPCGRVYIWPVLMGLASVATGILEQFTALPTLRPVPVGEGLPDIHLTGLDDKTLNVLNRMTDADRLASYVATQPHLRPSAEIHRNNPDFWKSFSDLEAEHPTLLEHVLILNYKLINVHLGLLGNRRGTAERLRTHKNFTSVLRIYPSLIPTLLMLLDQMSACIPPDGFAEPTDVIPTFAAIIDTFLNERCFPTS